MYILFFVKQHHECTMSPDLEVDEGRVVRKKSSLAVPPTLHTWKWSGETSITHSYTLECEFGLQEESSKWVTNVPYVLITCD